MRNLSALEVGTSESGVWSGLPREGAKEGPKQFRKGTDTRNSSAGLYGVMAPLSSELLEKLGRNSISGFVLRFRMLSASGG